MEPESLWWRSQLAADIHQTLRRKEKSLPPYKGTSPQIGLRRYFADLLAVLSHRFGVCPGARHLAVYLLDLFMDRYDVPLRQLYASALSCLLLACKFEGKEEKVPKLEQLNSLSFMESQALVLSRKDLVRLELQLLDSLGWNLCLPTPAHFIDYYLQSGLGEADQHRGQPLVCLEKTRSFLDKYTQYFLEVSMQDQVFLRFQPSQVASASIAASRICLDITPHWTGLLQHLTGYPWEHLSPCVELLLLAHDSDVKQANKSKSARVSADGPNPLQSKTFSSASSHRNRPKISTPLSQLCVLGEPQALRPAGSQVYLQPHQSGLVSGSVAQATFHSLPSPASGLGTLPRQAPISMQVAAESHPRHSFSLSYSEGCLSSSQHTFLAGCFDR